MLQPVTGAVAPGAVPIDAGEEQVKAWEAQTESQLPWLLTTAHTSGGELGNERTPGNSKTNMIM